jgi:WD40 repeat protein
MKYRAFISYRRQDASAAARWLREKLLDFRAPKELLDRVDPERRVDLERRVAFFLDTSYQSANEDFWTGNIEPALKESEYLIVLSSPSALVKRDDGSDNWVAREIDTFLRIHGEVEGRRRVIVALAPGAPEDRFPGRLDALGDQWDWADLRGVSRIAWLRAGTAERLGDALLKILARIHEVPQELLPILRQEEARKRGRLRVAAGAAAATLIAGLSALSWWALSAEREASRQRDAALKAEQETARQRDEAMLREGRFLARAAHAEFAGQRHVDALALALEALPRDAAKPSRPYTAEAEWMAQASLQREVRGVAQWSRHDLWMERGGAGILLPGDRRLLVARPDGTLLLVDVDDGRTIATLRGHQGQITSLVLGPDGRRAISTSVDRTARLWNLDLPDQPPKLFRLGDLTLHAALSPDQSRLLSITLEGVLVFEVATSRLLATLPHAKVTTAAFSRTGSHVLVTTSDQRAYVTNVDARRDIVVDTQGHDIGCAKYSPDGDMLLFCLKDQSVTLLNLADGTSKMLSHGQGTSHWAIFSPDQKSVLTGGKDSLELWTVPEGRRLWSDFVLEATGKVRFSSDSKTIFVVTTYHAVKVIDAASKRRGKDFGGHSADIFGVFVSADGKRALTAAADRSARLWDVESGQTLAILAHDDDVLAGQLSADGQRFITATINGKVKLWHMSDGPDGPRLLLPGEILSSARFSPDGRFLVGAANTSPFFYLWSTDSGAALRLDSRLGRGISKTAFSADGRRFAIAAGGHATVWSMPEPKSLWKLSGGHSEKIVDMALSHDGMLAITSSRDGRVKVWDVEREAERFTITHSGPPAGLLVLRPCVAISADATRVLVTSTHRMTLSDVADGRTIMAFDGPQDACAVFSPDGRQVLAARDDGRVAIYAADDGSELSSLMGHPRPVTLISFTPRGDRVLTVDGDVVRVWSMPDRRVLATLRGHADKLTGATFSPDGSRVISLSRDRTARLWHVDSGQTIGSFDFYTHFASQLGDASFSPSGDQLMIMNSGIVRLWRHLRSTQAVIDRGCATLLRPLDRQTRRDQFLEDDPKDPPCGWHPDMKEKPAYVPKAGAR